MAQGRRARRVLRKIDAFSLAKMAFLFHLCMALVGVVASVLLWKVADGQGLVDQLEKTVRTNLQLDTFTIDPQVLFRSAVGLAVVFAFLGTGLWILGALLFNMLSDLVGGVQVWVLEEVLADEPVEVAVDPEAVAAGAEDVPSDVDAADNQVSPPAIVANGTAPAKPTGREAANVG